MKRVISAFLSLTLIYIIVFHIVKGKYAGFAVAILSLIILLEMKNKN